MIALSFVFPAVAGANQHCLLLSRLLSAAAPPPKLMPNCAFRWAFLLKPQGFRSMLRHHKLKTIF
jgi:hypothetical protein